MYVHPYTQLWVGKGGIYSCLSRLFAAIFVRSNGYMTVKENYFVPHSLARTNERMNEWRRQEPHQKHEATDRKISRPFFLFV